MQTMLPTITIIGLSIFAFTANAVSTQDKVINTPASVETVEQVYRNNQYGFSFRYPSSWKVSENQDGAIKKLEVKSPSGFTLSMSASPQKSSSDCEVDNQTIMGTDTIDILKNGLTVHFVGNKEKETITYAYLLSSADPCPAFPFINLPNKSMVQIELYFEKLVEQPRTVFMADEYFTAKEILSSIAL